MAVMGVGAVAGNTFGVTGQVTLDLALGELLEGRITQVKPNGEGVFRLPSGGGFTFQGGQGLREGEQVRLEVVQTLPAPAVRVVNSESRAAARLAEVGEQSLTRAPETFQRLLTAMGFSPRPATLAPSPLPVAAPAPVSGAAVAAPPAGATAALLAELLGKGGEPVVTALPVAAGQVAEEPLPPPTVLLKGYATVVAGGEGERLLAATTGHQGVGGPAPTPAGGGPLLTQSGETVRELVAKLLPHVSGQSLLRGQAEPLVRLLAAPSGPELAEAVRRLHNEAAGLHQAGQVADGGEVTTTRAAMHRLADQLAMQDILPKSPPLPDGSLLLGYRVFWLPEGGFGEAVWQRNAGASPEGPQEGTTSVLLSLEMSQLGLVQARLTQGEGQVTIGVSAQDETALAALRERVGELRGGLLAAGLRVKNLDLVHLTEREMRESRQQALGLATGFAAQA